MNCTLCKSLLVTSGPRKKFACIKVACMNSSKNATCFVGVEDGVSIDYTLPFLYNDDIIMLSSAQYISIKCTYLYKIDANSDVKILVQIPLQQIPVDDFNIHANRLFNRLINLRAFT